MYVTWKQPMLQQTLIRGKEKSLYRLSLQYSSSELKQNLFSIAIATHFALAD